MGQQEEASSLSLLPLYISVISGQGGGGHKIGGHDGGGHSGGGHEMLPIYIRVA